MSDSVHQGKNEIVIVRRRHGGEEGHHGGAWKIAYADFMTAMMAFFLVMWLINAANEETKAAVASYFNPIKLTDERPAERGIKQVGKAQEGNETAPDTAVEGQAGQKGEAADTGNQQSTTAGEKTEYSDADYFKNPYAVLAEIAQETGTQTNISDAGDGGAQNSGPATGASGGEAYRDPFDPDFWSKQIEEDRQAVAESQTLIRRDAPQPVGNAAEVAGDGGGKTEKGEDSAGAQGSDQDGQAATGASAGEGVDEAGAAAVAAESAAQRQADELQAQLAVALEGATATNLADGLTVVPADGGLLISMTDQLDFGMFRIGSAVPERELVIAMETIGKILAEREGSISIRGYTDARPFTNGTDDNWRLSTERAHSAYFMLVRGGIPEERIVQLTGYADRRPKDPTNPYAEVNRRIEILLETDGG